MNRRDREELKLYRAIALIDEQLLLLEQLEEVYRKIHAVMPCVLRCIRTNP